MKRVARDEASRHRPPSRAAPAINLVEGEMGDDVSGGLAHPVLGARRAGQAHGFRARRRRHGRFRSCRHAPARSAPAACPTGARSHGGRRSATPVSRLKPAHRLSSGGPRRMRRAQRPHSRRSAGRASPGFAQSGDDGGDGARVTLRRSGRRARSRDIQAARRGRSPGGWRRRPASASAPAPDPAAALGRSRPAAGRASSSATRGGA